MSKDRLWIFGLDPGESTGLFGLRVDRSTVDCFLRFQGDAPEALHRMEKAIREITVWGDNVVIAGERFTTTDKTGKRSSQPTPLRVLGAAEQLSYQYTNVEFTLQSPADAKKLMPNARLRELGFYTSADLVGRPDANDVNDAARHALLGLVRRRASSFDAILIAADLRKTESQR